MRTFLIILVFSGLSNSGLWAAEEPLTPDTTAPAPAVSTETVEVPEPDAVLNPYKPWIGLQTGMALSNAGLDNMPTTQRVGMMVGVFYEAPILPGFLYFQPEVAFVQKGAFNDFFGASAGDSVRFNYLEMPLLAKVKFIIPRVRPFAVAGLGLGYMVGSSTASGAGLSGLNPFEATLILGAGLSFETGDVVDSTQLNVSARYSRGLTPVNSVGNTAWVSNVFTMLVGVQI